MLLYQYITLLSCRVYYINLFFRFDAVWHQTESMLYHLHMTELVLWQNVLIIQLKDNKKSDCAKNVYIWPLTH